MNYKIVTDSCANLTDEIIDRYNIEVAPLFFVINGKEYASYAKDKPTELQKYYEMMKAKTTISTACMSASACEQTVEPLLKNGHDVLFLSFSSQLSASCSIAAQTLTRLREKYPERTILHSDTLSGAMAQGLLAYRAAQKRENGEDLQTVYGWVEKNKTKACHIFTLDDLSYLHKGGRIKKVSYLIASTLNIKPLLQVDNEGKIVPAGKALGKRAAMMSTVKKFEELTAGTEVETLFVGHANNLEDAEFLKKTILERVKVKEVIIHHIDMVLGAHIGPGAVGLFFLGAHR